MLATHTQMPVKLHDGRVVRSRTISSAQIKKPKQTVVKVLKKINKSQGGSISHSDGHHGYELK